jgi:tungstate transport system ATP-binding protein
MILYSIKNLIKKYNDRTVLNIPALELEENYIYTLSGPNGAGKTTLLNILGFLTTPSPGQILFKNIPVKFNEKNLQKLRKSVILVNQHPILFSSTVYKNIEFGLKIRKIPSKKRKKIIESSLDLVGMKKFIFADARFLSGGETRRVAIARALACDPNVLLLDEPTADLDLESQLTIENIIHDIHRTNNITIVYCTHNLSQAARLSKHNINLFKGKLSYFYQENLFKGTLVFDNDKCYCKINEKVLIPVQAINKTGVKISIPPDALEIVGRQVLVENDHALKGRVVKLTEDNGRVRSVIDIGVLINLLMNKQEYDMWMPCIGETIYIKFNIDKITIL